MNKNFDEMNRFEKVFDTFEKCNNTLEEDRKLWDGMTKEQIESYWVYGGKDQKMDIKELENKFGSFVKDEKRYYITQEPYVVGDGTFYEANAIDVDGNDYMLRWRTTEEWQSRNISEQEDESEACNWDVFEVIE